MITAKLAMFTTDMLWESCLKFDFEQLSHSMFCKTIARLAGTKKHRFPQQPLNQRYSYRTCYGKVVLNSIWNNFPIVCSVRISLVQQLLRKPTFLGYGQNQQYSYTTYFGKIIQNLILNKFPIICTVKISIVWPLLRKNSYHSNQYIHLIEQQMNFINTKYKTYQIKLSNLKTFLQFRQLLDKMYCISFASNATVC